VKYGNDWAGWCTKGVLEPYAVSLWKFIRQGWPIFSQFIQFDLGAGNRVKIWHDLRCGVCALKEAYPKLYVVFVLLKRPTQNFIALVVIRSLL